MLALRSAVYQIKNGWLRIEPLDYWQVEIAVFDTLKKEITKDSIHLGMHLEDEQAAACYVWARSLLLRIGVDERFAAELSAIVLKMYKARKER